ncbi:MAG TPA: Calx-beta domain-containing protein, partial [Tepidisphaeraceae bacterium]|nr:Calx-beta domain-containing protein [Tepidisphaeraceae bacterium]
DTAEFTPATLSTIGPNAPAGAILSNPSIISESNGNFLAAWDEEDLQNTSSGEQDTAEFIRDNTFSSAGVIGTQQTIATEPNTSTSDNVLRQPFLLPSDDGTQIFAYYVDDNFGPPPDYNFGGSTVFAAALNLDGSLNGTPNNGYQSTAPNQIQLAAAQLFPDTGSTNMSGVLKASVQPLDTPVTNDDVLIAKMGIYNGGFSPNAVATLIFRAQTFILQNQIIALAITAATSDNVDFIDFVNELFYSIPDTQDGTTIIDDQPTNYTPPVDEVQSPVISIGDSESFTTSTCVFYAHLSETSQTPVTVHFTTLNGTAFGGASIGPGIDYVQQSGVITFNPGDTSEQITIQVNPTAFQNENFFVQLSDPSSNAALSATDFKGEGLIEAPPHISVAFFGVDDGDFMEFNITVSPSNPYGVDVNVSTEDGTAVAGRDYHPTNYVATIDAGETLITVPVPLLPGASPNLEFYLVISNADGAIIDNSEGDGLISSTRPTPVSVAAGKAVTITDGDGTQASVKVTGKDTAQFTQNSAGGEDLQIVGSDKHSKITITTNSNPGGNGQFDLGNIFAASAINSLIAPGASLDSGASIVLNGVSKLQLNNAADSHLINLGTTNNATVQLGHVAGADLTANGSIKSLTFTDWTGGSITAGNITTISASGNLDADLSVNSVKKFIVSGIVGGTSSSDIRQLRATNSFGTVSFGGLQHADLFVGVNNLTTMLPSNRSQFTSTSASIKSISITGASAIFSDANVAAPSIGTAIITGLEADNETSFGLVSEMIHKYVRGSVSKKKIATPQVFDSDSAYSASTI